MKSLGVLSLLLLATLAGCLSSSNQTATAPGPTYPASGQRHALPGDPMPEGAGHDHADPAQHKFLWNYAFAGRDALLGNDVNTAGVHALDLQNGWLFGAVYGSHAASVDGGLVIWDVHTDPAHPKEVGRWTIPGSVGGDRSMEATPDGDYAVISTEDVDCLGHANPLGVVSAYLIDARDKTRPVVADVITAAGPSGGDLLGQGTGQGLGPSLGEHSVAVHRIHGADYAFVFGKIYKISRGEGAAGTKLQYVSQVNAQVEKHDIYVRDTPWNTTWALAADGRSNLMLVWDVTNPATPYEVGQWDVPNKTALLKEQKVEYYIHTADVSFQDGHAVIVVTSEDFGPHVSPFWVLDGDPIRDVRVGQGPANLTVLGTWQNPGNHQAHEDLSFSLHNPRLHDGGILTLSSYHAGVWQLDLRGKEFWANPAPIAYAVYAEGTAPKAQDPVEAAVQGQLCKLGTGVVAPEFMDVEVGRDGVLYLADVFMGLYTFTPTADHPVYGSARTTEYVGTSGQ
ncbi:MAG: hypothetical protein QOI63_2001 [Thermoplasmata archaeon]|jgi:hypothetical protein|nr:hypothetical protein [Thermoplasmata archaeon]